MKIGFTGTQVGMTKEQKKSFRELIDILYIEKTDEAEFHHGDCIGADQDAHAIICTKFDSWRQMNEYVALVGHPPDIDNKRAFCEFTWGFAPAPYLKRNKHIVDDTEFLIAAPKEFEEQLRSGTWSTVRYARKLKKYVVLIMPDGTLITQ